MKTLEIQLLTSGLSILLLAAHWSENFAVDGQDQETNGNRVLSPEEEAFANEARAQIAKVIQENLVRLFAMISAEAEGNDGVKVNPVVLPQMAEIIGAMNSGRMNLTKIIDQTSPLVSVDLRDQVNGLVGLLTGSELDKPAGNLSATEILDENVKHSGSSSKSKKKLRQSATSQPMKLNRKQIKKLMGDIQQAVKTYEPMSAQNRDPKGFLDNFRKSFGKTDLNSTNISKNMPSIFMGAYKAIQALAYLRIMEPVTNYIEYELESFGFLSNPDASSEVASG